MSNSKTKKLHFCIVYDCLYPHTIGGAERWYRHFTDELLRAGHKITYVTRQQWDTGMQPHIPGIQVISVSRGRELYTGDGRRRLLPPLLFGIGVLLHLIRNRKTYDVVHSCAFPYFSLFAIRIALLGSTKTQVGVDWFEVWSREYWKDYLGVVGGKIGVLIQRTCASITPHAFVFSKLHQRRLASFGLQQKRITRLSGLLSGTQSLDGQAEESFREGAPTVVFAGRHIPEKQAHLIPRAIAMARKEIPNLHAIIFGKGPEHQRILNERRQTQTEDVIDLPGFVSAKELQTAINNGLCLLLPSQREGYGMVVLEAASAGTPTIVLAGEDNAATELIVNNVNGFIAAAPQDIAKKIVRIYQAGDSLRQQTRAWFRGNADDFSAKSSAKQILDYYQRANNHEHWY